MPRRSKHSEPELHGDAPKGLTTAHAAADAAEIRSRFFTGSPNADRSTTTIECLAFAR